MFVVLEKYLNQLKYMNSEAIERGLSLFEPLQLKKGDFFIKENQVCATIAFITQGSVKAYTSDTDGAQKIYCFGFENSFITVLDSFYHQKPAQKNIQATEDCQLLVISKPQLDLLLSNSQAWQKLAHEITTKEYLDKEQYLFHFQNHSVQTKFQNLLTYYPEIYKRIKLDDQASYIGTTARSLNRAKKDFFQNQIGQLS